MVRALLLLLVLGACEKPDPKLVYAISDDPAQSCGSTSCAGVPVPCQAVISIRMFEPGRENFPVVTICEDLPQNRNKDLCAISSIDLGDKPIKLPDETLEVQMVIWPRDQVLTDGELDCAKHEVTFDAVYGFPVAQTPSPAIGGRTFYHPGDGEIKVTLGCTNLDDLNSCELSTEIDVSASVDNFDNIGVLVSLLDAGSLDVRVGEPKLEGASNVYELRNVDTRLLGLSVVGTVPIWRASILLGFNDIACIQVDEDAAGATAAVRCRDDNVPPSGNTLDLRGTWLKKPTLDQILLALGLGTQFPPDGLTVGIVVDNLFNPVQGAFVSAPGANVRYLSQDRTTTTTSGGTSNNGIFISQDAPFTTKFSVPGSAEEVGGQIQGKVTVVVIQR